MRLIFSSNYNPLTLPRTDSALAKKINEAVERQDSEDEGAENPDAIVRPPSFDEYIKLIKNCDNLLDALRIRERINSEIMKKRTEIGKLHCVTLLLKLEI
jgi:hypothetical protein